MNRNDRTLIANERSFTCQQTEGETLQYVLNYATVLNGSTIASSTWTANGTTITGTSNTTTSATAKITAPVGKYYIDNTVTLANGETLVRTIKLSVEAKPSAPIEGDYED